MMTTYIRQEVAQDLLKYVNNAAYLRPEAALENIH